MPFRLLRPFASALVIGVAVALAACTGNMGSGGLGGLPVPNGQSAYQQPQGPSGAPASRERTLEGAVYVTSDMRTIPLPAVGGFALSLSLASAAPSPSPSASVSPNASPSHSLRQRTARVVAQVAVPSASPVASAAAAPAASGSPTPAASASPQAGASAKPGARTGPSPSPSGPKIETKLVVYPDYAPDAPTPMPSGNVQTFVKRKPIVFGYVSPAVDVSLYGLGAARFTIPSEEETPNRGFTIAVFTSAKKHKQQLIASDPDATLAGNVVSSAATTPLTLKKGTGYDIVLYGDELPATPGPVPSGYPTPGNNPFVTPLPSGMPGQNGYPPQNGFQTPYPGQQTPYPGQTYFPGTAYTPTPYPH